MADYSPMMKQYFEIKEQYPNTLLFFRLGDFYEMFFNDAKTASAELELTLTGRDCGQEERAPMCGVPFHSADSYIAKLVEKGYKVAICEQVEDPALAKGIVKREVIRVITPGTVLESNMLDESKNNYISSVFLSENRAGIVFADISTGEIQATESEALSVTELDLAIVNEFSSFHPSEILVNQNALDLKAAADYAKNKLNASAEVLDDEDYADAEIKVLTQFKKNSLEFLGIEKNSPILNALAGLFAYLSKTQITGLDRMCEINFYTGSKIMRLDVNTRRNLELTETMRNRERRGTLLWVLDKTKTAMGKRLLNSWVEKPLVSPAAIILRQNAIEELFENLELSDEITENLTGIYDLERIMTRIVYGSANGRELRSLYQALSKIPALSNSIKDCKSTLIKRIYDDLDTLEDVAELIDSSIVEEPPFTIREGGIIKKGFNEELDSVRLDEDGGKGLIAEIEAKEKERTGIPKLKVGYNRVFGYYIEITNSFKSMVPGDYVRKQTLTNAERYITEDLKNLENRILGAHDKSVIIESHLFEEIRKTIAGELSRIQKTAKAIAELDAVTSLANVARTNDYTRPRITANGRIYIKDGRHPVIEKFLKDSFFVPNDTDMDMSDNRVSVITGPNMAGKSTYMRQVALIVILAQIGSFVPASAAEIGIVDSIFTRVGASDDLAAGQSTFMLEMSEVSYILKHATKDSLIILDEIGRGTSTFDGMSIARAVLEYIQDKKQLGSKTLFPTQYHELTELEELYDGDKNFTVAVKKRGDDITFLRRIIRGGADDSFGIQVAKLAGIPEKVITRAKAVLQSIEEGTELKNPKAKKQETEEAIQFTFDSPHNDVISKLKNIDVNTLTPIESMNILFELANMLKD